MSGSLLASQTPPITISFNEIPYNLQVPGTFVEIAPNYDQSGLVAYPAKVCLLCPGTSAATITPLVPVQVFTPQQGALLLGAGGIGARMVAAFIRANPWTSLYVLGLPPAGGSAAATWTVLTTIAATLTGVAGPLNLYIGGKQYSYTVTPGVDTSATIATGLAAAINSDPFCNVTASAGSVSITLTSRDRCALANQLDVRWNLNPGDQIPGGSTSGTPNLTTTITNLATGAGVPSVANAFAAIPTTWFTHFVCPFNDSTSLSACSTEMLRRFNSMSGGLDARCFSYVSLANLTLLLAVTSGMNSQFISVFGMQNEPTAPWEMAALIGGVAVFNLVNDPARQLRNLVLPGAVAPQTADILTETERQQMLTGGMATLIAGSDGSVRIERAVSTYQYAPGNIPDTSWMDIMTAETMSRIRYDWISYVGLIYPRNKMSADGTLGAEYDPAVVTPRRMSSTWGARCNLYEKLGWIQNSQASVAASVFMLDATNPNRMDARQQIQIMNNLMILAGQMQFALLADQSTTAQT